MSFFLSIVSILFLMIATPTQCKTKLTPLTLSLGYHLDPNQAPILYALSAGIFEKHGLLVTLIPASGGEESSRQVVMKHAHIGITKSANHSVRVHQKHMPLVMIGTLVNETLEVLMVRGNHSTLPSLKGKVIGYSTSNPTFTYKIIDMYLQKMGLSRADVTLRAYQHGMMQAFLNGDVDALFTATHPHETTQAKHFQIPFTAFSYTDFGAPHFAQFIMFTHTDYKHANFIAPFLSALKESITHLKHNPNDCFQRVIQTYPALNTPLYKAIWPIMIEKFVDDPAYIDEVSLSALEMYI